MTMVSRSIVLLLLVAGLILCPGRRALGQDDRSELAKLLKEDAPQAKPSADAEAENLEPGDNKEFTVNTDDNIASLATGDVYRNNGCLFKVISIRSKGTTGGRFVVQRTAGKVDPGQKWARVSGAGPASIGGVQTLVDLYLAGGPFLHPIAALACVMVVLAFNCVWIYRRGRQCPAAFVRQGRDLLDRGDLPGFRDLALTKPGLFPQICRALVDRFDTSEPDDIKNRAEITAGAQLSRLRVPVRTLNLIAAAAPLLGLLGTIVGMIIVFEAIGTATGAAKAQALASGIRVKLFSTTAALMVAIPSLFLFFIFNQKLGAIVAECEILTEQFLHKIVLLKRGQGRKRQEVPADYADSSDFKKKMESAKSAESVGNSTSDTPAVAATREGQP